MHTIRVTVHPSAFLLLMALQQECRAIEFTHKYGFRLNIAQISSGKRFAGDRELQATTDEKVATRAGPIPVWRVGKGLNTRGYYNIRGYLANGHPF